MEVIQQQKWTTAQGRLLARMQQDGILYTSGDAAGTGHTGRRSEWMLYLWPLLMASEDLRLLAGEMLGLLQPFESTLLAAHGYAGIVLMTACIAESAGRYTGMVIRPEVKTYGARRQIDPSAPKGRRVVIVDDTISAGNSFFKAAGVLEQAGYAVEGTACLVDFPFRGGRERVTAHGYRVHTLFNMWDDVKGASTSAPLPYSRATPERWSPEAAPEGAHPASLARKVAEHYLRTGEILAPPRTLDRPEDGRGGVWVSFRRTENDARLGRSGFWHFHPREGEPASDVVLATVAALRACEPPLTLSLLKELKIAVSFFSTLELVTVSALDFRRYGIVVRSRAFPLKQGGALPNTQMYTSTAEQYWHARDVNARLEPFEPHDIFRHEVTKRVEPGHSWPAYGEPEPIQDGWVDTPGLGRALTGYVSHAVQAAMGSQHAEEPLLVADQLTAHVLTAVVALYADGLVSRGVASGPSLRAALEQAAASAVHSPDVTGRWTATNPACSLTVSLLYDPEPLGQQSAEWVAWKIRAGKDSVEVTDGTRGTFGFAADLVQHSWSKKQFVQDALERSGITADRPSWTSYKTITWSLQGNDCNRIELGAACREPQQLGNISAVRAIGRYIFQGLDENYWPAYLAEPLSGDYVRTGPAPRCLQALHALHEAGAVCGEQPWQIAAKHGIARALQFLSHTSFTLHFPQHACGPIADACLLHAVFAMADPALISSPMHGLAARVRSWVRSDGYVLVSGASLAQSDQDFLPGVALLALARYQLYTGEDLQIDWSKVRAWYRRRFQLTHPWGVALWHGILWPVVYGITQDRDDLHFSFEVADWVVQQQVLADGSFLTELHEHGPSFHTACLARGVAAAWELALRTGDGPRASTYGAAWRRAMKFMDRLIVSPEDAFWSPKPEAILGGVRTGPTNFYLRIDQAAYTALALIKGFAVADMEATGQLGAQSPVQTNKRAGRPPAKLESSGPTPMRHTRAHSRQLTEHDVVCLMIDHGVLSAAEIIAEEVVVTRRKRRNHNFIVKLGQSKAFFVKQAGLQDAIPTLRNEASVLAFLSGDGSALRAHVPGMVLYDSRNDVLVTGFVDSHTTNWFAAGSLPGGEQRMANLGKVLAALHALPPDRARQDRWVPFGVALHRPTLDLFRDANVANTQMLAAMQSSSALSDKLASLEASWQRSSLIHGDLKFDNIGFRSAAPKAEPVLFDWELAVAGDPRSDLGSVIGDLLQSWVFHAVDTHGSNETAEAHRLFCTLVRLIRCLLTSYAAHAGRALGDVFEADCAGFAAARVLQATYERLQQRSALDNYGVRSIQLAANLAEHPELILG